MPEQRPLILYHAHCADGFAAAWAAHRRFGEHADYLPVQYGQPPPDVSGRVVYVLDFSYKRAVMRDIILSARQVVVLDHHKTAQDDLVALDSEQLVSGNMTAPHRIVFDMNKSGGRLAWEHFFPDEPAPWLVDYTEDRDLWRWALPGSREVSAALASYPHDFALWDSLTQQGPEGLMQEGAAILRFQGKQIAAICASARPVTIGGHEVLAANTPVMISEVAGKLAEGKPFGATWFVRSDGKKQWSLRSREGGLDVSEIAKAYGGGGHKAAAGSEELIP